MKRNQSKMVYGCFGMYVGNMFFSWIINILIVAGLILLVVYLIKKINNEDTRRMKK
jgi:large-conductance mechanosensitive channel